MTTTKGTPSARPGRFVLIYLIGNVVLWAVFWGGFFSESTVYPKVQTPNEGAYVSQVVGHRAVSPNLYPNQDAYYRVSFIPNFPSFIVTRVGFNIALRGYRSPELYLGTTVGGYELICWMIVSFLQWYLVGRVISWLMSRNQQHVTAPVQ